MDIFLSLEVHSKFTSFKNISLLSPYPVGSYKSKEKSFSAPPLAAVNFKLVSIAESTELTSTFWELVEVEIIL